MPPPLFSRVSGSAPRSRISPVVLTSVEIRALQVLYGEAEAGSASYLQEGVAKLGDKGRSEVSPAPSLRWKPERAPVANLILCLDFGTSFSKAFACRSHTSDDVPKLIDVDFGENEDGTTQYFLPSELFIHDDRVFFGMAARRQFEIVEADQDRLIDSPKHYMTLGTEVAELHQKPLRPEQDPSQFPKPTGRPGPLLGTLEPSGRDFFARRRH